MMMVHSLVAAVRLVAILSLLPAPSVFAAEQAPTESASESAATVADTVPQLPDGFEVRQVAGPPLVEHPMLGCLDHKGRLFLAESRGLNLRAEDLLEQLPNFIRRLEDTDGDGVYDESTIFADGLTLPQGALWHRGALYVASPPNIWRFRDTDDDGRADERTVLVSSFGFNGNAASIHGCFLGPTGRLYWCDGRHGHEFFDEQGRLVSKGKAARIFSCRADGSDVQVHCGGGMDNPVEVDFAETGEMFGSVNILLSKPRVDCLMHWVEGGVYPRFDQQDCIDEFISTGDLLGPMSRFGHVAVSGMTRFRSDAWGEEYRDNLFTAVFNTHRVARSQVQRDGASFRTTESDFFVLDHPDVHFTDVLEDRDGSLLVIDTGGWFRIGCPTSQIAKPEVDGAIYRIRRSDQPPAEFVAAAEQSDETLLAMLDRPGRLREDAIDELAQRDEVESSLIAVVTDVDANPLAKIGALWVLSRRETPPLAPFAAALGDSERDVRLAASSALRHVLPDGHGDSDYQEVIERLNEHLASDDPAAVRNAAFALQASPTGEQIRRRVVDSIGSALANSQESVLDHALIYALIQLGDAEATRGLLQAESPAVARGALIALDQMADGDLQRDEVLALLQTSDTRLQRAALNIIGNRTGWADQTLSLLRDWLQEPLSAERSEMVRGFLSAQIEDAAIQDLLASFWQNNRIPTANQALLWEVVGLSGLQSLPESWNDPLRQSLADNDDSLRLAAIHAISHLGAAAWLDELLTVADDPNEPSDVRLQAFVAAAPHMQTVSDEVFDLLTGHLGSDTDALTRLTAAGALVDMPLSSAQLKSLAAQFHNAGAIAVPVLLRAYHGKADPEVGMALVTALQSLADEISLPAAELAKLLEGYPPEVRTAAEPLLASLGVSLEERHQRISELVPVADSGDASRGRELFFGRKANCAACHRIGSEGGRVGPDLSQIARIREPRDLVEAIVFPSASFARGYRPYQILTTDGRIHVGLITERSGGAVWLQTADLRLLRIPQDQVELIRESDVSLMPRGLEAKLTREEMSDLLAYLQSLR